MQNLHKESSERTELAEQSGAQGTSRAADPIVRLLELLDPFVKPLGYELVHAEVQTHKQKLLRLFIDFAKHVPGTSIGIEDCVKVTRAVDEPLDQDPTIADAVSRIFHGASYELEVSSPGVDRPLRHARDFERFAGQEARIHLYRPLTAEESGNPAYQAKNPKQKNFLGTLDGLDGESVRLKVNPAGGFDTDEKAKAKGRKRGSAQNEPEPALAKVKIPLSLISKANLEPRFELDG